MSALTGRTRYRVGWFGRLVLQVELYDFQPLHLFWRDARCDDFNVMGDMFAKAPIPSPGQKPAHVRMPLPKTVPQAPPPIQRNPLPPARMPASPAKDNE